MPTLAQTLRQAATATHACNRKPLYLMATTPARLDAGTDFLTLYRCDAPVQRYPLARIGRIVCSQHVDWSSRAMIRCLTAGIPVLWVDGRGHALGCAQTCSPKPSPVATLVETYLELRNWQQRFDNWLARRRLETLSTVAIEAARYGHEIDACHFEEFKRDYVYHGHHPLHFAEEGQSLCLALTVERLQREGLQSVHWGYEGVPLELGHALSSLIWAELNLACGTLPASAEQDRLVTHLFESWSHRREVRLLHHLADLKRHLAKEIAAWH